MTASSRRAASYLAGLLIALVVVRLAWLDWHAHDGALADDLPLPAPIEPAPPADPVKIEGHAQCIDCHAREVQAWMASRHATKAFDLLRAAPTANEYAAKLGIRRSDIARKSLCVTCHATPRHDQAGKATLISGVSCEACHNASGGEAGWLNAHAVYGPRGTRREGESAEHFAERKERCDKAGQLRSADTYQLVKRCFTCHLVGNEALVNARHKLGDFEVVENMLGDVRHNFFLDRGRNAEVATLWTDSLHHAEERTAAGRKRVLFIVGQLVDLETSLHYLSKATDDNDFTDQLIERIGDAFELLAEDLLEELEQTKLPEIEGVAELVEPIFEKLDDDGFDLEDRKLYLDAAEQVAKVAMAFAKRNGNQLGEIDGLDLIPSGPFDDVFQPGAVGQSESLP